ncbi:MAG: HD superfamily phosphohydrolase, partial [Crocinitomicaceae bacterium]
RIIEMLNVVDGKLVLEEKGIYSIEKFIVARRLMYWQVYLHKTVVAAEYMLIHALRRAKELAMDGKVIFGSPPLLYFLQRTISSDDFKNKPETLDQFALLDDFDILGAIKVWQFHDDYILAELSRRIVQRDLFKIEISREPFTEERIGAIRKYVMDKMDLTEEQIPHFVYTDQLTNNAYNVSKENINLLMKTGAVIDVSEASDNLNISALSNPVEKYFLCYPLFKKTKKGNSTK